MSDNAPAFAKFPSAADPATYPVVGLAPSHASVSRLGLVIVGERVA